MRLADLSAKDQAAIRAGASVHVAGAKVPAGARNARSARRAARRAGTRPSHTCGKCGRTFGTYPTAERHADEQHTGAVRIACALELEEAR